MVFIINVPGKEAATKEKFDLEIVLSLLSAMLDRLRTSMHYKFPVYAEK